MIIQNFSLKVHQIPSLRNNKIGKCNVYTYDPSWQKMDVVPCVSAAHSALASQRTRSAQPLCPSSSVRPTLLNDFIDLTYPWNVTRWSHTSYNHYCLTYTFRDFSRALSRLPIAYCDVRRCSNARARMAKSSCGKTEPIYKLEFSIDELPWAWRWRRLRPRTLCPFCPETGPRASGARRTSSERRADWSRCWWTAWGRGKKQRNTGI